MRRLVIASGNPGKLVEFAALLGPLGFEVIGQEELGIGDAPEPHPTFVENALAKARHASRTAGLPALADDSGLCVDALGGEPGVRSARYAGTDGDRAERDERNNAKLLDALAGSDRRDARYACVLVLLRHADDPEPMVATGQWPGRIARLPRGTNGFGYDPLFEPRGAGCTAAELELETKNRVSHRARAVAALVEMLRAS